MLSRSFFVSGSDKSKQLKLHLKTIHLLITVMSFSCRMVNIGMVPTWLVNFIKYRIVPDWIEPEFMI